MRWIGAVTIIGVLTACGDAPSKEAAPRCTLPGCKSPIDLGPADALVGLTGEGVVFGRHADPPMGDLWFRSLRDGSTTQIAAGIPIDTVRLDRDGGVLFLSDTREGRSGTWDPLRGSLRRWDSRTGLEQGLLEEVRPGQYDVCGDWAWAWHGPATQYVNCGNTSVIDLRDGQATPIAISCDSSGDQRAFFAEGCQVVVYGAPDVVSLLNLVIHDPAAGASHSISGAGTSSFVVSDDVSMAAIGSKVTSLVHPNEQLLPERGRVLAFAPGGGEVVYVADEPRGTALLRLWEPGSEAPERLSEFPGGAWIARYSPDGRLLAWIEAGGFNSLHVLDRDTGVTEEIASDVKTFSEDGERFWRPAPRVLAFAGEGHWLVFSVRGPDQELQLVAWDRESRTTRVLSRSLEVARKFGGSQPLAIAVGHRVAWLENGRLRLADLKTEEDPAVVANDVLQFTIGRDEIVWTNGKGKASALVFGP